MARNDKSSVSSLQNEEHKRILTSLLREEGNRRCADCNSRGPTWASVNLGVFVCLNCSGIHRSLGVHISKVRSTNLDTWLPEQVAFVQAMGNVRCNKFWEARLPRDFHRPPEADMSALRVYITDKYVNKRYALQGYSESPCIENYQSHPFVRELATGGQNEHCKTAAEAVDAPVANAAPVAAAVPQFDLLSLHDDPAPPLVTSNAPDAAQTTTTNWDPFAAIAREQIATPSVPLNSTSSAPPAPIMDPFAEIERTASTRSTTNTTTTSSSAAAAAAVTTFSLKAMQPSLGNNGGVVDPFALPPMPPPQPAPTPVAAPAQSLISINSSGLAPMRSASTTNGGHSKGKVSHEDILAMFDK